MDINQVLAGWDNFYVIVGSSAGALTGLMFVVITLTKESRASTDPETGVDAFASPTVVHFCLVLLIAAILSSPHHTPATVSISVGTVGIGGLGYSVLVILRIRKVKAYAPVGEDWLWHVFFPLIAYGTLVWAAVMLWRGSSVGLFAVAATALLLLYTGIHNAWDTAAWMATHPSEPAAGGESE